MDTWQVFIIYEVGIRFIIYKWSMLNLRLEATNSVQQGYCWSIYGHQLSYSNIILILMLTVLHV